jgi:hypothetical protein
MPGFSRWTATIASVVLLAGCSNAAVCSGDAGPETLEVDASALAGRPGVTEVVVCIAFPDDGQAKQEFCNGSGTASVSLTTSSTEYPASLDYHVDVVSGSNHVFPEGGGGTSEMTCTATTTKIVLPVED